MSAGGVVKFLSEEWLAERFRLAGTAPESTSDVTIRIQHVVTGGPAGTIRYYDDVVGGRLIRSGRGDVEEPTVTITNEWADELAVLRGEIDPADIVIEGRLIVDGDPERLIMLLPALNSPIAGELAKVLSNVTEP